jgi:CheY-like chemotaxis protein/anti-sigma regulatory factor (Ser/Thr protein kinase)
VAKTGAKAAKGTKVAKATGTKGSKGTRPVPKRVIRRVLIVDDDRITRHVLSKVLASGGYGVATASDGLEGLEALRGKRFDLILLDVWMPRMNGLEMLAELRTRRARPRVVIMTTDDTPEMMLRAVRDQALKYVAKPMEPGMLLDTVREAIEAPDPSPIEVVSARPDWVELVVPCTHEAADRIQAVMARLETTLPQPMRDSLAIAFRELLMNAIEWGGKLDPAHKVRIACLRCRRMLMYRIADPGPGFKLETLTHAAVGQPADDPIAHMQVREETGIRPGGFGLLMVRETADELLYNEKRNEVVFVKYLDETSTEKSS